MSVPYHKRLFDLINENNFREREKNISSKLAQMLGLKTKFMKTNLPEFI